MTSQQYKQMVITEKKELPKVSNDFYPQVDEKPNTAITFKNSSNDNLYVESKPNVNTDVSVDEPEKEIQPTAIINQPEVKVESVMPVEVSVTEETEIIPQIKFIGEAFSTYIIVEKENSVFFIDKHASHERIIFERLKKEQKASSQELLLPVTVKLTAENYNAVLNSFEFLEKGGFEAEDFGNNTVIIRAVPSALKDEDVATLFYEVAANLAENGSVEVEKLEDIYHTVACKAAIKAGYRTSKEELLKLATEVLTREDIFYCPHGRPVAFEIKKRDLEKQFGRIQ